MAQHNLTQGSIPGNLFRFSLPYLLSCFLQAFYGLADLFIVGQFNGADVITAVSLGSQVTHMITVVIMGLAMGTTVTVSRAVGSRDRDLAARAIGSTVTLFALVSLAAAGILLLSADGILALLATPPEALTEAKRYLMVSFAGIPFITAYNVISSTFRGLGDSRSPMYFVAIAGVVNVGLDYLLIGPMAMGALGAALATVTAQALSVLLALLYMKKKGLGVTVTRAHLRPARGITRSLLTVGLPVALQDGFIQVAFLVITVIANMRGVDIAAAVGIVEKAISFFFLVPSSMLSAVSAIAAQNAGAELHSRARKTLYYGIAASVGYGILCAALCQVWAEPILQLFAREEPTVIAMGAQYLRAYSLDCMIAGIHFCFSGFFCAYQRAMVSFVHNLASVLLVRIPGTWLASLWFPLSLYPMGLASPLGSLLSALICLAVYLRLRKTKKLPD